MTMRGLGGLVQFTRTRFIARSGRRLMFRSSDTAVELDSALVAAGARSAGFPWDHVTISIPGMAGMASLSAKSTLPISTCITVPVLLRCTLARGFQT